MLIGDLMVFNVIFRVNFVSVCRKILIEKKFKLVDIFNWGVFF